MSRTVLLTYDSILVKNTSYTVENPAVKFIESLQKRVNEFAQEYGLPVESINWELVENSDWCKGCLIVWAYVPIDWEPPSYIIVLDKKYSATFFSNSVRDFRSYIRGRGECTSVLKNPPSNPHKLFRSIEEK